MDKKTLDFVLGAIESLKNDQKIIARKVISLTNAVKNSIDKIKRETIDVINELERDKLKLENMIKKIDDNLEDVHKKINESLTKIGNISDETQKQCIFDRKGFRREEEFVQKPYATLHGKGS